MRPLGPSRSESYVLHTRTTYVDGLIFIARNEWRIFLFIAPSYLTSVHMLSGILHTEEQMCSSTTCTTSAAAAVCTAVRTVIIHHLPEAVQLTRHCEPSTEWSKK